MKILFAGWHNPNFMSLTEYIEHALSRLGHTLELFEYRQFMIPGRIRNTVPFLQNYDVNRINNKLIDRVGQFKPDILFILQGDTIKPETIDIIKSKFKVITVNWYIDQNPLIANLSLKAAKHYDHFFYSHSDGVRMNHEYGNKNVKLLYFACDPNVQKPVVPSADDIKLYGSDIVFVGSHYPERERTLSFLADMGLSIWGPRWSSIPASSPLHKCIKGGTVDPSVWIKIFNCSKIVLNIHAGFDGEKGSLAQQATCKVFEILACGSFEITDSSTDVNALFQTKRHLITYSSNSELKEHVIYYLSHENERKEIARNGYNEVIAKHTYTQRMKEMLKIVTGE